MVRVTTRQVTVELIPPSRDASRLQKLMFDRDVLALHARTNHPDRPKTLRAIEQIDKTLRLHGIRRL